METKPAQLELVNGVERLMIRPLPAWAGNPIHCRSWDLGSPEMRYTSVPNPGADGVTVSNGYIGSRTVVLELQILGDAGADKDPNDNRRDAYWYAQQVTRMVHPAASPTLYITRHPGTIDELWRMDLRGTPFSLTYERRSAALVEMQVTFTCPLGMLESAVPKSFNTPNPGGGITPTDWIFDAVFPKGFGLIGSTYPLVTFEVDSDAAVTPVLYIFGPAEDPEVHCDGDVFRFDGLTLIAGETVVVDMGSGAIYTSTANSAQVIDDMNAYGAVDWAVSTYWVWEPGTHTLQYMSKIGGAQIQFRERRLTI